MRGAAGRQNGSVQGRLTKELLRFIHEHVYRYRPEPFTLASGRTSHHYFNCKKITLSPEPLRLLVRVLVQEKLPETHPIPPQAVGGLTLGADPIAYALALEFLNQGRLVYPLVARKEAKDHGTGRQVEGEVEQVQSVLVLDDVITTGGSTLKAVAAFRAAGLETRQALCIVDRQEGGREALAAEGIELLSLFTKEQFQTVDRTGE